MKEYLVNNSRIIAIGGIIAAVLIGGWFLRDAYADYKAYTAPKPTSNVVVRQDTNQRAVNVDSIVAAHLFGDPSKPAEKPKKVEQPKPQPAPETKLNVTLLGLIGSEDGNVARALVKIDNQKIEVVAVGDELGKTGAVVNRIFANEMIIERSGVNESVKLAERKKRLDAMAMLPQPGQEIFDQGNGNMNVPAELPQGVDSSVFAPPPPMPGPGGFGNAPMPFDDPFGGNIDEEFANEFPEDMPTDFPAEYPDQLPDGDFPSAEMPEDFPVEPQNF